MVTTHSTRNPRQRQQVLLGMWRNGNLVHSWWWECKMVLRHGKQRGGFSNIENRTTLASSNPASGYKHQIIEIRISKRYLHFYVRWSRRVVDEWIKDMWCIHIMENCSAVRKRLILPLTAWNKADTKGQRWFHLHEGPGSQMHRDSK